MANYLRAVILTSTVLLAAQNANVQTGWAQARKSGPQEQPVDPGVPVGCLLNPNCGPNLFIPPGGRPITPDAPVDPIKGLPCLIDPTCSGTLGLPPRAQMFQRPVSQFDIERRGALIGDFIPLEPSQLAIGKAALGSLSTTASCTAGIIGANEVVRSIQNSPDAKNPPSSSSVQVLVSAYISALRSCEGLNQAKK